MSLLKIRYFYAVHSTHNEVLFVLCTAPSPIIVSFSLPIKEMNKMKMLFTNEGPTMLCTE
jgi:hypothetical protein